MSRRRGCFETLATAILTISTAMANQSEHPSPMLDLVDAFNLTAIDLHDLDLADLFPDGLPTQEPPVFPGHPDELYEELPSVVNQQPLQTPLIPLLRDIKEESYTTKRAEDQHPVSSNTTEKHNVDGSNYEPTYENDATVLETEGLDYETPQTEARETVVYELMTPTVRESMPTTRQEPAQTEARETVVYELMTPTVRESMPTTRQQPAQYDVKSTTQYETNLPTLNNTQPRIEYETNPPVKYETNPPVRYETNQPILYEINSPTRHEQSPHRPSTLFLTSSDFKEQTTEALQAYPTTTALFVRMTDPREPTVYTPRDSYGTSLGYDVANVSSIPTKMHTRASPHPAKSTKKVSPKQTKLNSSRFDSTIRSFAKAKRPHFGEKLGLHGEIRGKSPSNRPQRKNNVHSGHSKLTYDEINRRRNTKRQISKQPTVKWVKIPSTRPPSTTPSKHYISEYKPIKIMHHRDPYKIRNQSTLLTRTPTKPVPAVREDPATPEVIAPYNSHSNPKLHTTTPSYDVNTGRSPTTLQSKPSFEISMKVHQQVNPELMSDLLVEEPAVDYMESHATAATSTNEDQTTREVLPTQRSAQTTTIKEKAHLRPATKLPHPSGSDDKERVPLRKRPDGSYLSLVPATEEPSYNMPLTVKAVPDLSSTKQPSRYVPNLSSTKQPSRYVPNLSSTKQPSRYRPQKLKQAVSLPVVAGGSAAKNYATSYVISNTVFRKHSANRSGSFS